MNYKIVGEHPKGRGYCGHIIRANTTYHIAKVRSGLGAFCIKCVSGIRGSRLVTVPKDLKDGAIPVVGV